MSLNPNVIANVRRLRRARRLTAEALAAALKPHGVTLASRHVVANWESGRRPCITVDELAALAAVFDVEPWSLTQAEAACLACQGDPPAGFTCNNCGMRSP